MRQGIEKQTKNRTCSAADAAKKGMIIRLIDGEEPDKTDDKNNIGVRTKRKIEIKIVDTAYFMSGDE